MAPSRSTVHAASDAATFDLARHALEAGELVLLPTETVYGIAARADDPAALERLRACKQRDAARPLSLHIGLTPEDPASRRLPADTKLHGLAARLVDAFWPGPLTLAVETADPALNGLQSDGLVGLRAPHHPFTSRLLAELDVPVVLSSANTSGEPPAVDVPGALASLGARADDLAVVVDDGPTATSQAPLASSVLVLAPGRFDLTREGLLSRKDLQRAAGLALGFVCTGNTCRSPLAEAFARLELERALGGDPAEFGFHASSFGLAAGPGGPASKHSVDLAAEAGADLTQHRSRQADLETVLGLDRIYTMTAAHRDHILGALRPGDGAPPVETLHPEGRNIADPFGGGRAEYEAAAQDIRAAIRLRLPEWI